MKLINPSLVSTTGSVTRSGTATYYDSAGILQTSSSGALRFGHDPDTLEYLGLIIEESRANIITYSEVFSTGLWPAYINGGTRTTGFTSPDSLSNATKFVSDPTGSYNGLIRYGTVPSGVVTISVWMKADNDNTRVAFGINDSKVDVITLTQKWKRYSKTALLDAADVAAGRLIQIFSDGISNQSWYLFGAQFEVGSGVSSYIPTTSSVVTRAAEVITGSGIVYTSLTNSYSEWSSATTYSLGQIVSVGTYTGSNTVTVSDSTSGTFKSLTNSNTNNNPLTSTSNWVRIGPTNQFAMFDSIVSSQSQATTEFTVCIKTGSLDAIGVLNILGASVSVAVADASLSNQYSSNVVFKNTRYLTGGQSVDWYSYFFYDPDTQLTQAVYLDVPSATNNIVTIRVKGTGTVKAGILVEGLLKEIGNTQYGATAGIIDYSKKETDEFGNTRITVRNYSKRLNAKVHLTTPNLNRVQRLLYNIRSSPVLWIASDSTEYEEPLVVYGYYKSFDTEISYPTFSQCNLEIEGLI